uniref:Uncharacterized protein n=1 Tax=Wuchereria bancrofti TaxID=6293 RepID=A0A1I8ETM0_WUCBA
MASCCTTIRPLYFFPIISFRTCWIICWSSASYSIILLPNCCYFPFCPSMVGY